MSTHKPLQRLAILQQRLEALRIHRSKGPVARRNQGDRSRPNDTRQPILIHKPPLEKRLSQRL